MILREKRSDILMNNSKGRIFGYASYVLSFKKGLKSLLSQKIQDLFIKTRHIINFFILPFLENLGHCHQIFYDYYWCPEWVQVNFFPAILW